MPSELRTQLTATDGFTLERGLLQQRFGKAATCAGASPLAREVARRMDERLDYIKLLPTRILDIGCGSGEDLLQLAQRYPQAARIALDFALPMLSAIQQEQGLLKRLRTFGRSQPLQRVCGDFSALPLARSSVSMVWSNLALNWLSDPFPALKETHRVLETGGMLMFSTLGPDTLKELRAALDDQQGRHVHRFIDMHDIGDALLKAGFSDPVMDMEILTITYQDIETLFSDLRLSGCNNASTLRPRGLGGKAKWARARARLEALRQNGRVPASFEIIQGHAWKTEAKTTDDGRAVIRFQPPSSAP